MHPGLDIGSWSSDPTACKAALLNADLAPGLANSLILLLIKSPSTGIDLIATGRALSLVADLYPLLPPRHLPSDPLERILFEWDVRAAAAEAVAHLDIHDVEGGAGPEAASHHCKAAEAAVRRFYKTANDTSLRARALLHLFPASLAARRPSAWP